MISNGVRPVVLHIEVFKLRSNFGIPRSLSRPSKSVRLVINAGKIVLFSRSTWPFAWGWRLELSVCLIPWLLKKDSNLFEVKAVPLSVIKRFGAPNQLTNPSNFWTTGAAFVLVTAYNFKGSWPWRNRVKLTGLLSRFSFREDTFHTRRNMSFNIFTHICKKNRILVFGLTFCLHQNDYLNHDSWLLTLFSWFSVQRKVLCYRQFCTIIRVAISSLLLRLFLVLCGYIRFFV